MSVLELGSLLVVFGLVTNGLLFIVTLVQALRRGVNKPGWFSGLLFVGAALSLLITLVVDSFVGKLSPQPVLPFFVVGLGSLFCGLVVLFVERRKDGFVADASFGLLLTALGTLGVLAVLLVPVLPEQFSPSVIAVSPTVAAFEPSVSPTLEANATAQPTLVPSMTSSPTVVPSNTPLPTATPTRERYSTRTPTATPIVTDYCGAVVNYNLNLRNGASSEDEVLLVIPFESIIDVGGQNSDGDWWFVEYNGVWGWVDGEYVTADARCNDAPVLVD